MPINDLDVFVVYYDRHEQSHETAHYKEIVTMDGIAKLFNPMNLASATQDIRGPCHA